MSDERLQDGKPGTGGRGDASRSNEVSGTVFGVNVQANSIHGGVQYIVGSQTQVPVPAQLPSPGIFASRLGELAELRRLIRQADDTESAAIVVITGTGGVGKTTLGLHWLHQVQREYDDGQLFVDLRGFSDEGGPMSPSEPLERFLRALGVDSARLPINPDEQAAMFRSLTTGRRLIVMLDNAASAAQVRPLLPVGPSLVLVTTRRRLTGLVVDGARFLDLHPLSEPGALELLDLLLGSDRVQAEPQEANSLVALCGRLPIAVCASGARLASRSRWSIARVVRELADESRRLSALSMEGDVSIQAVFDLSYQALPDDAARLYRLLALHPGSDFDPGASTALIEVDRDESARLLDVLVGANLLEETGEERFRFHDLLRLHAREKLARTEPAKEHRAATGRLVEWYLATSVAADIAAMPGRWHLGRHYEDARHASFDNRAAAIAWLELELTNLIAVLKEAHHLGFNEAAWQIVEALWGLFLLKRHYRLWIESHEIGVAAARACRDSLALARMLEGLGYAFLSLRDFDAAVRYCDEALGLEQAVDHPLGEASALEYLGIARLGVGENDDAITLFTRAKAIHQRLGRPRGVALMTRHIGDALDKEGRHVEAAEHFTEALQFFIRHDEHYHEARTLTRLGKTYLLAGQLVDADAVLHRALAISQDLGARNEEAGVHVALARLSARRGEPATERKHLERALVIYTELNSPEAEEVMSQLAGQLPELPDQR